MAKRARPVGASRVSLEAGLPTCKNIHFVEFVRLNTYIIRRSPKSIICQRGTRLKSKIRSAFGEKMKRFSIWRVCAHLLMGMLLSMPSSVFATAPSPQIIA